MESTSKPSLSLLWATLLFAIATGLAALLARHALLKHGAMPGCGATQSCSELTATHWGYWGPVPVAVPATLLYAASLAGLLLMMQPDAEPARTRQIWRALIILSLIALGAATWFVALQAFILRHYCPFCLAIHLCASLGAVLVLHLAWNRSRSGKMSWITCGVWALASIALMIAGQVWLPRADIIKSASSGADYAIRSLALPPRELVFASGRVKVDAASYPALGFPAAEHVAAVLFDYTCQTCRANHPALLEALRIHGSQLTILLIPTPLDPACNTAIARLMPEHADACNYARYAMAVWRTEPGKFAAYDAWLMAGAAARPPPLIQARRYAEALVGAGPFGKALADAGVEHSLRESGQIYRELEAGIIPKLLLPDRVLEGDFSSQTQLGLIMEQGTGDRASARQ